MTTPVETERPDITTYRTLRQPVKEEVIQRVDRCPICSGSLVERIRGLWCPRCRGWLNGTELWQGGPR